MLSLENLVACLPKNEFRPEIIDNGYGFIYVDEDNPLFVPPPLKEPSPIASGVTSTVLITAPAAVGKTTTAQWIAKECNAPLWDLAGRRVAQASFVGSLDRSFKREDFTRLRDAMNAGEFLVVIDALEESEQISGEDNFEEFLIDLFRDLATPRTCPAMILLARGEVSLTTLHLEATGIPYAHLELDYFGREQAYEFIGRKLDSLFAETHSEGHSPPHRQHSEPFSRARDKVFSLLCQCLGADENDYSSEPEARRFLGYAPVLEAISAFLQTDNYQVLNQELDESFRNVAVENETSIWRFLANIIEDLLKREHSKVNEQLKEKFGELEKVSWTGFYLPDDQLMRVANKTLDQPYSSDALAIVPLEQRADVERILNGWFARHPFLYEDTTKFSNKVFEEYFHAKMIAEGTDEARDKMRKRLSSDEYLPNHLFGHFLLLFSEIDGEVVISAEDVGNLYDSIAAQEDQETDIGLEVVVAEDGSAYGADSTITVMTSVENFKEYSFAVSTANGPITFSRKLINSRITFPGIIELGGKGKPFRIGPFVEIECDEIKLSCDDLLVLTVKSESREEGDVIIIANRCDQRQDIKLRKRGNGEFGVCWDGASSYPWSGYELEIDEGLEDSREINEAFRQMCRILRVFASRKYGNLSKYKKHVWKIVRSSKIGQLTLECMLEKGILTKDASHYHLNADKFATFGLDRNSIKFRRITPEVNKFLKDCLGN